MNKKLRYLGLLLILPVFTVALTSTWETLPVANALTSRSSFNDNHYTALYPGGPRICGDHVCAPGEYDKMQQELSQAQMKGKAGSTSTQTMMQGQNMSDHSMMQAQNMHQAMASSDLGSVLKLSNANLPLVIPLVRGLYDGKDVFYITTEASDSDAATGLTKFTNFPVTFAPALANTPPAASANIYLFKNGIKGPGIMGFQPQIVDSIPGDAKYSPLWRVNVVEWKDPTSATMLGSEDEVLAAESNGKVTITPTHIVVNCPIVQWGGNKEGTIQAGHMKIRDGITESGSYGSAQVLNIDTQKMQVTFVAHRGFAPDGSTIYYIATDASQMGPADMLGIVLASKTQATITTSSSADLYQFSNGIKGSGPLGFQSGVGATKPGDQYYSPMWRIQVVTWKDPSMATVLENTQDLTSKSDMTTTTLAGFIVNCPFFSVDTVYSHMK
ncbi:MAG TPA: hypothetical protein VEU72_01980 [Nitrosopumilaceae archaeon]|nr:hypothetical protein [Nitrosopumilaceae archaeon]